jgi:hypothetical protein
MTSVVRPLSTPTATQSAIQPPSTPTAAESTAQPLQVVEGTEVDSQSTLGEAKLEYPVTMSAGSSDMVILSIEVPLQLASLDPTSIVRVQIPPGAPHVLGTEHVYRTTILVGRKMRAELSSPAFAIDPLHPATQPVEIQPLGKPTVWAWSVQAPDFSGLQLLTVRIYLGEQAEPSWVGGFQVKVTGASESAGISPTTLAILVAAVIVLGMALGGGIVLLRRRGKRPAGQPAAGKETPYNIEAIRELLLEAFTAETFHRFCEDKYALRPVVKRLGENFGLDDMVDEVIGYCSEQSSFDELLLAVKQAKPRQYARFEADILKRH